MIPIRNNSVYIYIRNKSIKKVDFSPVLFGYGKSLRMMPKGHILKSLFNQSILLILLMKIGTLNLKAIGAVGSRLLENKVEEKIVKRKNPWKSSSHNLDPSKVC